MSLEAIQKVTEMEQQMLEQKRAAEAEARAIIAEAEKSGLALMQKVQTDVVEYGKTLVADAENHVAKESSKIQYATEAQCNTLREIADQHMEEAVEFIVGRVVNQ